MVNETTILRLDQFGPNARAIESGPANSLAAFVLAAVCGTDEPLEQPRNAGDTFSRSMLALITYCYARGVYESSEIERKLRKGGIYFPDAKAIQHFRRLNRARLQAALEKVLGLVRGSGDSADIKIPVTDEARLLRDEAAGKLEIAALLDISLDQ